MKTPETGKDTNVLRKTPEEIKNALDLCSQSGCPDCAKCAYDGNECCLEEKSKDALAYIQQLEKAKWELLDDLSTAYYGKRMYGLNDDGTVYSRYSCDTMSFEQAVREFRRLISDD